jgi:hypothetical protein
MVLFAPPPPSPDLPIKAVIEFLNVPDMVVVPTRVSRMTCCKRIFQVFRCSKDMLQVFHLDVVKVNRDVAYVAIAIHVCCKYLFQMFHLFF